MGLGSNLGDRLAHLQAAVDGLARTPGVEVVAVSPVYETAPVGGPPQDDYLNAVVALDTELTPRALLDVAQRLEAAEHRVRRERWGPRTLDVDVLLVGDEVVDEPDLVVPHPRLTGTGRSCSCRCRTSTPEWAASVPADRTDVRPARVELRLPE